MRTQILLTIAALLLTTACSDKNESKFAPIQSAPPVAAPAEEAFKKDSHKPGSGLDQTEQVQATERLIIRNANLSIVVDSPAQETAKIEGITQTLGGFVVNASSYGTDRDGRTDLTIRVPSDGFDQAMHQFRALGDVSSESVTGEDVTEEFVDLQARLKVQRSLEGRFINLLADAQTIDDTLAVERELTRVREQIERMEGRTNFLKNQARMATIRLQVSSEAAAGEATFGEIGEAFSDSGEIIITVIAGAIRVVAALLPIALMMSLFGFVAIRLFSALRRRRSA